MPLQPILNEDLFLPSSEKEDQRSTYDKNSAFNNVIPIIGNLELSNDESAAQLNKY